MPIQCPKCAQWIPDGQSLCPRCGADRSAFMQAAPGPYQGYQAQPEPMDGTSAQEAPYVPQGRRARRSLQVCPQCGRPLVPGETCVCQLSASQPVQRMGFQQSGNYPPVDAASYRTGRYQPPPKRTLGFRRGMPGQGLPSLLTLEGVSERLSKMKYHMGFGSALLDSQKDVYEENRTIVSDCVAAGQDEKPIRQYELATLRNRVMGFTSATAQGRLLITTQRVIFRAPGRTTAERTSLQHEAAIDAVGALEASSDRAFLRPAFLQGLLCMLLAACALWMLFSIGTPLVQVIARVLLCLVALGMFLGLHKSWLIKTILCGGAGLGTVLASLSMQGADVWCAVLGALCLVLGVAALWLHSLRPSFSLALRTYGGELVLDIRPDTLFHRHCGFAEIEPAQDADRCIREAAAIIRDVQAMGASAAEKWRL